MNKNDAIKIITTAAKKYEDRLCDKEFLIVYIDNGVQKHVEIGFRSMYFLHMTGVSTKLSAQRFYEAALENKLSERDFEIDNRGKAVQKLRVLPYLHELPYNNCMIGDFINSGVMIQADYFVGDTKLILSVGFRHGKTLDIPVTLYSGDVRKLTAPTNKVLAIFRRTFPEKTYAKTTYVSKDTNISEIALGEDVPVIDMGEGAAIKPEQK